MKKNILIIILVIITTLSFIYAKIKADEATRERMASELARNEALAEKNRADILAKNAQEKAAEALSQADLAAKLSEELQECQSK